MSSTGGNNQPECHMLHSAWQDRLKPIIGAVGYQSYMRRSMQTVVLYEAQRCIAPRVSRLRPFQKRALLMSMVYNILSEIDFMTPSDKEAVLWKTQRSQEQLDPATAWKRCRIIERDLNKLLRQMPKFASPDRPHGVAVDMLVQTIFVSSLRRIGIFNPYFHRFSFDWLMLVRLTFTFAVSPCIIDQIERSPWHRSVS